MGIPAIRCAWGRAGAPLLFLTSKVGPPMLPLVLVPKVLPVLRYAVLCCAVLFVSLLWWILHVQHKSALAEAGSDTGRAKQLAKAEALRQQLDGKLSWVPGCARATATLVALGAMAYGFYLLSPSKNPWGWDGYLLLSKTHGPFRHMNSVK